MHRISKDTAEHYTWGGNCDGWHLVKNAELSIIEERMPSGTAEVRHFHQRAQQFFYILLAKQRWKSQARFFKSMPGKDYEFLLRIRTR